MERDSNGKVIIVIIVIIQPVLELTPVQVIQARPTGSWVSVTVRGEKGQKRVCNIWSLWVGGVACAELMGYASGGVVLVDGDGDGLAE